jgi:aminopeptidase N
MKTLNPRRPYRLLFRALPLILSLHLLACAAFGQREERETTAWQPINYDIAITLNDQLSEISKARVVLNGLAVKDDLNVVDLDFGDLTIDSVKLGTEPAKTDRTAETLNIHLPTKLNIGDKFEITIEYHGRPKDGLILAVDKDGKPSATGDNWPNRVHHWIPCLDHPAAKATAKFTVTAPARDLVVANGKLDGVVNDSQTTRTWTYTEGVSIPAYCMIIAVGEYAKFESPHAIVPLSYYVPQSDAQFAVTGFSPAAPSLKFFSETVAPYPYEKLALIVGATRFGGMENSSAIVFSMNVLGPRPNPRLSRAFNISEGLEQVVAHEIAHQWFGDSVTEASWADLWLSEGFATYFAGLFVQKFDGEEAFQAYMKRAADSYFAYEKKTRTPIHDRDTKDLMDLLNANNYQKGAWVLHMLRSELGDRTFFEGLRLYYKENQNSVANTKDLREALEKVSARKLDAFFESWIFRAGHPQYDLSWKWIKKTKTLRFTLTQLQPEPAFPNRVPVEIMSGTERTMVLLRPTTKQLVQNVKLKQAPTAVKLDPNNTILKDVVIKAVR